MFKSLIEQYKQKKRLQTASDRVLPNAVIIGAQKAGTTSLFSYIAQHPNVVEPFQKEIHYFDTARYTKHSVDWYRSFFPTKNELQDNITLEATPCYMFYPDAIKRLKQMCSGAKLLMVLNDPSKRAISSYYHQVRRGREKRSIEDAFNNEEQTVASELEKINTDSNYFSETYRHFSYLKRGVYIDQVKTCHKYFNKSDLKIINSVDLFARPLQVMSDVYAFLGIDSTFRPTDLGRKNQGERSLKNPFGYSKKNVPEHINRFLKDYYTEPNKQLFHYLNQDFGWQ